MDSIESMEQAAWLKGKLQTNTDKTMLIIIYVQVRRVSCQIMCVYVGLGGVRAVPE